MSLRRRPASIARKAGPPSTSLRHPSGALGAPLGPRAVIQLAWRSLEEPQRHWVANANDIGVAPLPNSRCGFRLLQRTELWIAPVRKPGQSRSKNGWESRSRRRTGRVVQANVSPFRPT